MVLAVEHKLLGQTQRLCTRISKGVDVKKGSLRGEDSRQTLTFSSCWDCLVYTSMARDPQLAVQKGCDALEFRPTVR